MLIKMFQKNGKDCETAVDGSIDCSFVRVKQLLFTRWKEGKWRENEEYKRKYDFLFLESHKKKIMQSLQVLNKHWKEYELDNRLFA
jgi:hypothetical protein